MVGLVFAGVGCLVGGEVNKTIFGGVEPSPGPSRGSVSARFDSRLVLRDTSCPLEES